MSANLGKPYKVSLTEDSLIITALYEAKINGGKAGDEVVLSYTADDVDHLLYGHWNASTYWINSIPQFIYDAPADVTLTVPFDISFEIDGKTYTYKVTPWWLDPYFRAQHIGLAARGGTLTLRSDDSHLDQLDQALITDAIEDGSGEYKVFTANPAAATGLHVHPFSGYIVNYPAYVLTYPRLAMEGKVIVTDAAIPENGYYAGVVLNQHSAEFPHTYRVNIATETIAVTYYADWDGHTSVWTARNANSTLRGDRGSANISMGGAQAPWPYMWPDNVVITPDHVMRDIDDNLVAPAVRVSARVSGIPLYAYETPKGEHHGTYVANCEGTWKLFSKPENYEDYDYFVIENTATPRLHGVYGLKFSKVDLVALMPYQEVHRDGEIADGDHWGIDVGGNYQQVYHGTTTCCAIPYPNNMAYYSNMHFGTAATDPDYAYIAAYPQNYLPALQATLQAPGGITYYLEEDSGSTGASSLVESFSSASRTMSSVFSSVSETLKGNTSLMPVEYTSEYKLDSKFDRVSDISKDVDKSSNWTSKAAKYTTISVTPGQGDYSVRMDVSFVHSSTLTSTCTSHDTRNNHTNDFASIYHDYWDEPPGEGSLRATSVSDVLTSNSSQSSSYLDEEDKDSATWIADISDGATAKHNSPILGYTPVLEYAHVDNGVVAYVGGNPNYVHVAGDGIHIEDAKTLDGKKSKPTASGQVVHTSYGTYYSSFYASDNYDNIVQDSLYEDPLPGVPPLTTFPDHKDPWDEATGDEPYTDSVPFEADVNFSGAIKLLPKSNYYYQEDDTYTMPLTVAVDATHTPGHAYAGFVISSSFDTHSTETLTALVECGYDTSKSIAGDGHTYREASSAHYTISDINTTLSWDGVELESSISRTTNYIKSDRIKVIKTWDDRYKGCTWEVIDKTGESVLHIDEGDGPDYFQLVENIRAAGQGAMENTQQQENEITTSYTGPNNTDTGLWNDPANTPVDGSAFYMDPEEQFNGQHYYRTSWSTRCSSRFSKHDYTITAKYNNFYYSSRSLKLAEAGVNLVTTLDKIKH